MTKACWAGLAALGIAACGGKARVGGLDADSDADADTDSATDSETDVGTDTGTDSESVTDSGTGDGPCDREYVDPIQTVLLNEVFFDVTDDQVELRNDGDVGQPLTRWVLATGPDDVYPFPAGLTIPPHGFVVLHWTPIEGCDQDEEACGLGGFLNDLTAQAGDLLLLRGDDLDCADAVVDYVHWGDAEVDGKDLGDIASEAGQWPLGDWVDLSEYQTGDSMIHDASDENGRTHWFLDSTPTLGDPNYDCDTIEDCFAGLDCIGGECA